MLESENMSLRQKLKDLETPSFESPSVDIVRRRCGRLQRRSLLACFDMWCSISQQRHRRRMRALEAGGRVRARQFRDECLRSMRSCWLAWQHVASQGRLQQRLERSEKKLRHSRQEIDKLRSASAAAIKQAETSRHKLQESQSQAQYSVMRERQLAREQIAAAQIDAGD